MLIALIILYLSFQLGTAAAIHRFASGIRYKRVVMLAFLFGIFAWTRWVDMAAIYRAAPNKYGLVFYNPVPLFVTAILSLLSVSYARSGARWTLYVLLWFGVNALYFGNAFYNPIHCVDRWDRICCLQTTDSTCAAAAAATLARLNGIATTEEEMKNRCLSGVHGTTLGGLYHGLRDTLDPAGKNVFVDTLSFDAFLERNQTAIVYVMLDEKLDAQDKRYARDWGWIVGTSHVVVFLTKTDATHILIADPANGLEKWNAEALRRLWRNTVVGVR